MGCLLIVIAVQASDFGLLPSQCSPSRQIFVAHSKYQGSATSRNGGTMGFSIKTVNDNPPTNRHEVDQATHVQTAGGEEQETAQQQSRSNPK